MTQLLVNVLTIPFAVGLAGVGYILLRDRQEARLDAEHQRPRRPTKADLREARDEDLFAGGDDDA